MNLTGRPPLAAGCRDSPLGFGRPPGFIRIEGDAGSPCIFPERHRRSRDSSGSHFHVYAPGFGPRCTPRPITITDFNGQVGPRPT